MYLLCFFLPIRLLFSPRASSSHFISYMRARSGTDSWKNFGNSTPPIRALAFSRILGRILRNHKLTNESTGIDGQESLTHTIMASSTIYPIPFKVYTRTLTPNIICDRPAVLTLFKIGAFIFWMHTAHFGVVTVIICGQ